jgi:hypothetical protein
MRPGPATKLMIFATPPSVCLRHGRHLIGRLDAVLQGQHERLRPDEGRGAARRVGDLPGLDRQHHAIDHADATRVVRDGGRVDRHVSGEALHVQTRLGDRRAVRAPRDERDVMPRLGQASSEITSDTSDPDHCEAHGETSMGGASSPATRCQRRAAGRGITARGRRLR